jgi:hypothetical protein
MQERRRADIQLVVAEPTFELRCHTGPCPGMGCGEERLITLISLLLTRLICQKGRGKQLSLIFPAKHLIFNTGMYCRTTSILLFIFIRQQSIAPHSFFSHYLTFSTHRSLSLVHNSPIQPTFSLALSRKVSKNYLSRGEKNGLTWLCIKTGRKLELFTLKIVNKCWELLHHHIWRMLAAHHQPAGFKIFSLHMRAECDLQKRFSFLLTELRKFWSQKFSLFIFISTDITTDDFQLVTVDHRHISSSSFIFLHFFLFREK